MIVMIGFMGRLYVCCKAM